MEREYDSPLKVLESELLLTKIDAGIMYENIDRYLHIIAFIDLKENRKM